MTHHLAPEFGGNLEWCYPQWPNTSILIGLSIIYKPSSYWGFPMTMETSIEIGYGPSSNHNSYSRCAWLALSPDVVSGGYYNPDRSRAL